MSNLRIIKKGYIYIARNPLMPHLVKIGKTVHRDLKKRHLDASNIPDGYEALRITSVADVDAIEKVLHRVCRPYHYEKEFFYACCVPLVIELLDLLSIDNAGSSTPPPIYHGVPRKKKA